MRKIIIAALIALLPTLAAAQQFPTVPSGTVIGRTQAGTGPAQAIPFASLLSTMLSGTLSVPAVNTNSVVFNGSTSGQVTVSAQAVAGTPAIKWPNTSGTVADNATAPIILNATTGNISCPSCLTSASAPLAVASRAAATALDLSSFSAVSTLGYTTAGDGGGALFKKVAAGTAFKDTYITAGTITTAGTGYVNGTYYVGMTGGSATGCAAQAVVAGTVVTAISLDFSCSAYKVGDVLSIPNSFLGGTGSGFAWTVTTISAPGASFTDSAGNLWQYLVDQAAMPNVRQFGAKQDWSGSDGGATNDILAFRSAIAFAYVPNSSASALVNGTTILVPKGASLLCDGGSPFSTLLIPQGITLRGMNAYGSTTIKQCASEGAGTHFVSLCSRFSTRGQIGCKIQDLALISDGSANGSTAQIYSASGQQFPLGERLWLQAGLRGCIYYEKGIGGAANAIFADIDCEGDPATTNSRIVVAANVGSTQFKLTNAVIEMSGVYSGTGIALLGGSAIIDTVNFENVNTAITVSNILPTKISNITSGPACTTIVSFTSTNPKGITALDNLTGGGCTTTVNNGHTSGSPSTITGSVMASQVVN